MRRAQLLALPLALLALLAGGLLAGPAHAAAPARSAGPAPAPAPACRLPGYVSARPQRPCPALRATRVGSDTSVLGWVGGLFGGLVHSAAAKTAHAVLKVVAYVVLSGAADALRLTGSLIGATTGPRLLSAWFSGAYKHVLEIAVLLTVPFLFAAAVHALVRSDLGLLARAAFGYLPLAMLGVGIASPLTMAVLRATDLMCRFMARVAGHSDSAFLARAAANLTTPSLIHGDIVMAFVVAGLTVVATIALWVELLIRSAAVYVIVLMLPLFFAAMVWPARRTWAVRSVETLVAVILAKFVIVAVLALGGAALTHYQNGPAALLTGVTLILLATASPWALLRLLPLHEVAAAAAGGLSREPRAAVGAAAGLARRAVGGSDSAGAGAPSPDVLGPEETEVALRRILIDSGVIGAGGSQRSLSSGSAGDSDDGSDEGIAAIAGAGGGGGGGTRPSNDPPSDTTPSPPEPGGDAADPRGPIDAPFGDGEWQGFVIGDSGEERMEPPRLAANPPPADGGPGEPGASAAPDAPPPVDPPPAPDAPPSDALPPVDPPPIEPPPALGPPSLDPPAGLEPPPPPPPAEEPPGEEPA